MPSIEQCETAAGSVAALSSTLDFFDAFKCISSVSEDGKDSDSEESFHLPLDDDDMESRCPSPNQSVVSNGRDKEIHNEETEDDILNKFETVPSGTPDNIDSHIEDSILDDENLTEKESESKEIKSSEKSQESSDNTTTNKEPLETNAVQGKSEGEEANKIRVEVQLKYDFEEYEDSGDGEFKSIYENDELTTESVVKEPKDESLKIDTVEPMEITDEPVFVGCFNEQVEEPRFPHKSLPKVAEPLDNFEDSMEVEQEDTNQDIANIIEKLEDHDIPMANVEPSSLNDESDVNMVETCENATVVIENSEKDIPEKSTEVIQENTEDVEMTGNSQNNGKHEECKENVNQVRTNESLEEAATFQEPLETSKGSAEAGSGETQEQNNIIDEGKCPDNKTDEEEDAKEDFKENEKPLEDDTEIIKRSESPLESEDPFATDDFVESEKELDKQISEKSSEVLEQTTSELENEEDTAIAKSDTHKPLEEQETNKETPAKDQNELLNDDLLMELDKTINETGTEKSAEELTDDDKTVENVGTEPSKEPEGDKNEPEIVPNKEEDVFKAPIDVPRGPEEMTAQKEAKEALDLQNEKSNDKTDEDESDLLDISMIRETEEDDACAIADALNDKEAQISEKSDEEQSEKVETEQEGSDGDKDNDNDPLDFDDTDDDSHMEAAEHDDSSNAESTKDKIAISESSKDSVGESETKKRKKSIESYGDASNDASALEVSASESGEEPEKMDVPDSLIPDKSINLESTLVQDEAASTAIEKDLLVPSEPSKEETQNKDKENSKTDTSTEKAKERDSVQETIDEVSKMTEDNSELRKSPTNKRTHTASDTEDTEVTAKKPKLASTVATDTTAQIKAAEKTVPIKKTIEKDSDKTTIATDENEKVKTLTGFSKFMQCRQFTAKLSRSDLEQFCIQKICESLMLKSSEGELHQAIKKHEKTIENLRKDMQQLGKQCKDLEIVNKKLMNELRSQNSLKKPLVPLKITRSVGLQVRLNPGNEATNQTRRRQMNTTSTPQKQTVNSTNSAATRPKVATTSNTQQPTVVRQVLQNSPQKSPLVTGTTTTNSVPTNPLLSQALQQTKPRQTQAVVAKRTATPVRKEAAKPGNPGVIDLTDEDDKLAATKTLTSGTIKIVNKTVSSAGAANKTLINKVVPGKAITNQGKQVGLQKAVTVGQNKGTTLSQGIRLTPASVITSNSNGSPQMVYVVPTITSNAGGTQKVAFVNFQPTNGVLSGALNGSTVSVMSNKGQTLTLKTVPSPMRNKHPATLPPPPRINLDPKLKPLLPKPHLTIKKIDTGIILQWKMPYNLEQYENIASYQLYAYQETSSPPSTDMWRKVGDVKALALPMACTLTQFADKNKYYFAVRSVDVHKRIGAFSDPEEISL